MATYYVATDGSAEAAGDIDHPWTLAKANATLAAGDTCYLRAGTYTIVNSGIDPVNTGTAGNLITYSGYESETVILDGGGAACIAIDLDSNNNVDNTPLDPVRSYIKVTKITFTDFYKHLWIQWGGHIEVSYCSFIGMYAAAITGNYRATVMFRGAKNNWVHHCTFGKHGQFTPTAAGDLFAIGNADITTADDTSYNLVENCTFYHAGHAVFDLEGHHNVVRNNFFHNEGWLAYGGEELYSDRIIFSAGIKTLTYRNLFEGNIIGFAADTPPENATIGGSGGTWGTSNNIVRRNRWYKTLTHAMRVAVYTGGESVGNHIYNNTFWSCGNNTIDKDNYNNYQSHPIYVAEGTAVHDNVIKNNIFYQNGDYYGTDKSVIETDGSVPDDAVTAASLPTNWMDNAGDPGFVDITSEIDPTSSALPDLRLVNGSPCIDNGAFLTSITTASGSGTSFVVSDAGYFCDGWDIVTGDSIQLEGDATPVTVTAVDYDTNTITVDTEVTWTQGDGVALAYYGSAPDQGYYETPSSTGDLVVSYSGNGATSGAPPSDATAYSETDPVTVLGNTGTLAYSGYIFYGWNTAADGSGTHYDAADTFAMPATNMVLYAEWKPAYALLT